MAQVASVTIVRVSSLTRERSLCYIKTPLIVPPIRKGIVVKLKRISHMIALGGFVAALGLGVPGRASAAPTAINCPSWWRLESDFSCTYQASPYEQVVVATNVAGYRQSYTSVADANGTGEVIVGSGTRSGDFRVCVGSSIVSTVYVCDYGTVR